MGNFASAFGALLGGALVTLLTAGAGGGGPGLSDYQAYRLVLVLYSVIGLLMFLVFSCLSPAVEPAPNAAVAVQATPIKLFLGLHESKWLVLRLSLLFCIDSFAGGFVLQSLLANWFATTWHTKPAALGTMLFMYVYRSPYLEPIYPIATCPFRSHHTHATCNTNPPLPPHSCNLVAGISALFAAQLAKLIGLISTMVFTHLPSNVMMILVPLMPTQLAAISLLCLRFCISQMDVPTRNR